jgi:hypothetical protein
MGGNLITESLVFPKTALLILKYDVLRCHARGTSFLFPETEALLDRFFELNETILQHTIPYSLSDMAEHFFVSDSLTAEECDQHHFVF